jgi:hypothetical protein
VIVSLIQGLLLPATYGDLVAIRFLSALTHEFLSNILI